MSSSSNSSIKSQKPTEYSKPKLSALYSLEFYKKQNKWKFSSSREAKKPQKSDEIKQKTETEDKTEIEEQSDLHNTPFIDTVSDTRKHELSQNTPKTCVMKRLQELQKLLSQLKVQTNAEDFSQDCPESVELKSVSSSVERNIGNEECVCVSPTDVTDGLHYPEDPEDVVSLADWPHGLFGDMTWNEAESANCPQEAEDWSLDSEVEFMRGAHVAPQSSEAELELPPELTTSDVSSSSLCRLSTKQLLQAVQQHSLLLRKLLQEREHRQNLRIPTPLNSSGSSIEDFLSWTVGPYNRGRGDLTRNTFYKDVLITGSYKNVGGVGRGRGRFIVW